MDCSLPGSSVHGIFQARVLEWGAIAFSNLRVKVTYFLFLLQRWTDLHLDSYIHLKFILFILKLNNTNLLHLL